MFQCSKCGECCRNLNNSDLFRNLHRGDGVCIYLDGNLCSIYEKRPLLCRVDESYEKYFKEQYSLEEYYNLNYQGCRNLQNR